MLLAELENGISLIKISPMDIKSISILKGGKIRAIINDLRGIIYIILKIVMGVKRWV